MNRWREAEIDEVCNVEYGTRVVKKRDAGTIYPVYGGGGATFCMDEYNREDRMVVARFGMSEECTRFVEGKFFLNDSGLTVSPKDDNEIHPRYLDYHLLVLNDVIYSLSRGSAQRNLNTKAFREILIGFPEDLAEQKRIVAILDAAFAAIDTAHAHAQQNLTNARELFESHLNAVFEKNTATWDTASLQTLANIQYGHTASASAEALGPQFLRITDIQDRQVHWDQVPFCEIEPEDYEKYRLAAGDIVFARTGATTGKSYLVTDPPDAVFASYLIRVQLENGKIAPEFLYLFFQTNAYWERIRSGVSGSTQGGFNATKLGALSIPVPTAAQQGRIVTEADCFRARSDQLTTLYTRKLDCLAELKQSILAQAFTGELTADTVEQGLEAIA